MVDAALSGLEDGHIDPELRELDRRLAVLVREPTRRAPRLRREPFGVAHIDDEPTLRDGGKPGASVLKPRFVHEPHSRSPIKRAALGSASANLPEADPDRREWPRGASTDGQRRHRRGIARCRDLVLRRAGPRARRASHDRRRVVRARHRTARPARRDRHDAYAGRPRPDRALAISRAACRSPITGTPR